MSDFTGRAACTGLLAQLGGRYGMGPLQLDADGACTLRFARRLEVCLAPGGDSELALFAVLGALPAHSGAALARHMLAANFLWHQTAGATLALAPDGNVSLARKLALHGLDGAALDKALQSFVEVALAWQERLAL